MFFRDYSLRDFWHFHKWEFVLSAVGALALPFIIYYMDDIKGELHGVRAITFGAMSIGAIWLALGIFAKIYALGQYLRWVFHTLDSRVRKIEKALPENGTQSVEVVSAWPWGSHHTESLGHLAAAAEKFWKNYDPSDVSTAPTNEMVSEWLRQERGVSREKATSIASILRADGLKTGPRR